MKPPRKIFDVYINSKQYAVYDIDGKDHLGLNGEPKSWWLYYTDQVPEGTVPPHDSEHFVPYSNSLKRRVWEIKFREYNTSKYKWDEWRFSKGCQVEMWCDQKPVYSFGTLDIGFAMAKAQYLMTKMSEHPYNFFEPEKEKGRKVWFYGLPATIRPRVSETWEIKIYPDYATIPKLEWWGEYYKRKYPPVQNQEDREMFQDEMDEDSANERQYINWGDALSDQYIWWFRE